MLRATCLRSAVRAAAARRSVATVALRRTSYRSSGVVAALKPVSRVGSVAAVRAYSADSGLREAVEGRIMSLLSGFDKVNDNNNIKPNAHFANDLGLDSLDTVEVVMAIEEEFSIEIPDKDADAIHSVNQAVDYILKQPDAN